jgi:hypothetical protein
MHQPGNINLKDWIERCFYVDVCLPFWHRTSSHRRRFDEHVVFLISFRMPTPPAQRFLAFFFENLHSEPPSHSSIPSKVSMSVDLFARVERFITDRDLENENWHAGHFSAGAHFEGVILQTWQFREMHEERNARLFVVDKSQTESFHLLAKINEGGLLVKGQPWNNSGLSCNAN